MLSSIPFLKTVCSEVSLKNYDLIISKALRQAPKAGLWGFTAFIAGSWYAYPALTEKFKSRIGLPNTLGVKKGELGAFVGLPQADAARRSGKYEQENVGTAPESQ